MSAHLGFGGSTVKTSQPLPKDRRLYLCDGREVLITLICQKCGSVKPLSAFGLRRMDDGSIRSIPWCKRCRGVGRSSRGSGRHPVQAAPAPREEETKP